MYAPSVKTGVTWSDLLIPETKQVAQFWTHCTLSISCLGTPQYKTVTIIQAWHNKSIDHHLKVILAQILPQSADESNCQHSLFACLINMMRLSSQSKVTPRLQTGSASCTLALLVEKSLRIGFLTKQELNWMTSALLGLHTNLRMVFHSITSLIHFWRVLRTGPWSRGSIVMYSWESSA